MEMRMRLCTQAASMEAALLPLPARGERVGVRGRLNESELAEKPPHPALRADLSPQAGRGERIQPPFSATVIQRVISSDPKNSVETRCTPAASPVPCATATIRSQRRDKAKPTAARIEPSAMLRS